MTLSLKYKLILILYHNRVWSLKIFLLAGFKIAVQFTTVKENKRKQLVNKFEKLNPMNLCNFCYQKYILPLNVMEWKYKVISKRYSDKAQVLQNSTAQTQYNTIVTVICYFLPLSLSHTHGHMCTHTHTKTSGPNIKVLQL